ncbi:MAG: Hsp20/alpha crystallin family protein [Candidatus Binatia bacterium]|nr:Hsp20/alpha crystallin family protein [Candidatus Binatia bacterium]
MAALVPWRPMRELERLERRMEDLFERVFGERFPSLWDTERGVWREEEWIPAVESHVEDGELVVKADLPGIDPKDVSISVTGNQLTIEGERKREEKKEKKNYFYRELQYGKFSRTMTLPSGVETDKIKATYKDGVLDIRMPAPKDLAPKRIQIDVK